MKRVNIFTVIAALLLLGTISTFPFGKNKVNREVFEWNILKTIHFDIYYPVGMERLARYAGRLAEEGYVFIANSLHHELTEIVPIILYPSHIAFQENNIILQVIGEGTGGFTESFKRRMVLPFTGSYIEFRHVLIHELVHAFHYNILFDDISGEVMSGFTVRGVPLWIMEGMSEYLSIGYDETADMVMRDILYNEKYASLMDLTKLHVRSGYLIYKEGQAFYHFLVEKYGREKIGELFRDIRDLDNFYEAIKVNTGKTLEELNLEWIRYFKKIYFPVVKGKKFDEEEGEQLTFHQKTNSTFNVCPAVSPDGKKIAYLTNREIYSDISIITVDKKKKEKTREIKTVVYGSTSSRFEGMHLLSNYLTWSGKGNHLAFVAQSYGRDVIFIINPENGDVRREIELPFRSIKDPALSRDGTLIAFIGQMNDRSDLYLYDIEKRQLYQITDDLFAERYPKISSDNSFVIFSSNWNDAGDVERDDYDIFKITVASRQRSILVGDDGNDLQADLSADDKQILYISNRTGIYNAYRYDLESGDDGRITNVLCGIFYPRWFNDGKRMAFVAYQNLGYDIFLKEIAGVKLDPTNERDTEHHDIDFPPPYFDLTRSEFVPYETRFSTDYLFLGVTGTTGYGLAGIVQMAVSDYLGNHRIVFTGNYFSYNRQDVYNYDVAYYYLKHRLDYGIGMFRQENPFGVFTLSTVNELIHNVYWDTLYMDYYGVYGIVRYPFTKFYRMTLKATSSRYEVDYALDSERRDAFANLNQLSLSFTYDNVIWGYLGALDGFRGTIGAERTINVTGQDFTFTNVACDLRRYFFINKRYVLALSGSAGKIFGPDSEYFKYYLGGFTTLRGHPIFEYNGKNVFLGSVEFRFIFIEGIKFGWPLFFRTAPLGGVLFADFGSAWDGSYRFRDPETGEFDDFKADFGFGFRLTLFPIIFKLDYAWPHYYKYIGDKRILFSIGLIYWD